MPNAAMAGVGHTQIDLAQQKKVFSKKERVIIFHFLFLLLIQ